MADYVVEGAGDEQARGIDLVDGDTPPIRMIVRGALPTTIQHGGRTWMATGDADVEGDAPPIAVYRPVG